MNTAPSCLARLKKLLSRAGEDLRILAGLAREALGSGLAWMHRADWPGLVRRTWEAVVLLFQVSVVLGRVGSQLVHSAIAFSGVALVVTSLLGWSWAEIYALPFVRDLVALTNPGGGVTEVSVGPDGIPVIPSPLPPVYPAYDPFLTGLGLVLVARLLAGFGRR